MSRRSKSKKQVSKDAKKVSKRKFLFISLCVLMLGLVGGAFGLASTFLSKNYITQQIEEKFNCRVEIGDFDISAFTTAPEITLKQLKLAERDSFADDQTPHDDRPALEKPVLEVGEVKVKVGVFDLLFRKIDIRTLFVDQVKADVILYKSGRTNIDPLFVRVKEEERAPEDKGVTFNAKSNKELLAKLKEFKITNSQIKVLIESSGLSAKAEGINVHLGKELELDLKNLAEMSATDISASARILFYGNKNEVPLGMMELAGSMDGFIFNKETADFDPDVELEMMLGDASYINRVPAVRGVSDYLFGVDKLPIIRDLPLNKWPETILFNEDKTLKCHWNQGKIRFTKKLSMDVGDWTLAVQPDSWLQANSNNHAFHYKITASESLTEFVDKSVTKLVSILPKKTQTLAAEEVKKMVYVDGRFIVLFSSSGSFSRPKMKVETEFPKVKEIGKKLLGDLGGGLLKLLKD